MPRFDRSKSFFQFSRDSKHNARTDQSATNELEGKMTVGSISKPNQFPKRSGRFGVGKEIGGAVYVHRQYESVLPAAVQNAKLFLPKDFAYTVIKYVLADDTVSFIESPDFDSADEPTVGNLYTIKNDGKASFRRKLTDPWIYHHKWLFVADDYAGFDAAASKLRSRQWLSLDDIDFQRIGKESFWTEHVVARLIVQFGD